MDLREAGGGGGGAGGGGGGGGSGGGGGTWPALPASQYVSPHLSTPPTTLRLQHKHREGRYTSVATGRV